MSNLTFLPAPWYLAVPDFADVPGALPAEPPPLQPFGLWRLALAVTLVLLMLPAYLAAESAPFRRAQRIYAKLQRIETQTEIAVKLRNGDRLQGRLASFDQTALRLDGVPGAILLDEIATVKPYEPRNAAAAWSPATGFLRSGKSVAMVGGLLIGAIILVATNTE